jgi:hypothetical protein
MLEYRHESAMIADHMLTFHNQYTYHRIYDHSFHDAIVLLLMSHQTSQQAMLTFHNQYTYHRIYDHSLSDAIVLLLMSHQTSQQTTECYVEHLIIILYMRKELTRIHKISVWGDKMWL